MVPFTAIAREEDDGKSVIVHRKTSSYRVRVTSDSTVKQRSKTRKLLFHKRNRVSEYSLAFALIGIALAIIEAEATANADSGITKVRDLCALKILRFINGKRIYIYIYALLLSWILLFIVASGQGGLNSFAIFDTFIDINSPELYYLLSLD